MSRPLQFKLAETAPEFEAIHRLNHRTFAEEIPQHAPNPEGRLVDRFHAENTYAIALDGGRLVGMIAGRCERPFSLDAKLPDLDRHLPPHRRVVEVRLLAVEPAWRKQAVFAQLAGTLARHFRAQGCDLAIISGTLRELKLYRHLGFRPFGPLVGDAKAPYQPMAMTLSDYAAHGAQLELLGGRAPTRLLPGPVTMRPEVAQAHAAPPVPHRSPAFQALLRRVQAQLAALGGLPEAVVMPGSGTTANDAIGAQLAADGRPGLVLANGEFGERLVDHARRWGLACEVERAPWGEGFDLEAIARRLRPGAARWLWCVLGETSTGVANPLPALRQLCQDHGLDLCVDAVSALGLQPLDLRGVRWASTVSGKALGAYPGLAIVLHDGRLAPAGRVVRSLDLAAFRDADGVAYTLGSAPLAALAAALQRDWPARFEAVRGADARLRTGLRRLGFGILASDADAMTGVVTLVLPPTLDPGRLARRMERHGYELAWRSRYLVERGWLQICLMGEWDERALEILPEVLAQQRDRLLADAPVDGDRPAPPPSSAPAGDGPGEATEDAAHG